MDQPAALAIFESLSSGIRLDVFRLLVRAGPDGVVAGEIATALDLPPSSLSFHLRTLTQSGLLTVEQKGRFLRYRANLPAVTEVIGFLTENCCSGAATKCAAVPAAHARVPSCIPSSPVRSGAPKVNVLFLCAANSCPSILAEAIFNAFAPAGTRAMSAGSQPAGYVHPRALALLAREGIAIQGLHSKSWDALPAVPDVVITLCPSVAGEPGPASLASAMRVHWAVADPAKARGSAVEINAAFEHGYRTLRTRIEAFLALPEDLATREPAAFRSELDRIGKLAA